MISNELIDNCAKLEINSVQLHLIFTIIRYAYGKDSAWPSIKTIQRKTGLSIPAITKNFKKLEEKGYIIKTHTTRKDNGHDSNMYSFKPLNDILERLMHGEKTKDILADPIPKEINPPTKRDLVAPTKGNLVALLNEINPNKNKVFNKTKNSLSKSHSQKKQGGNKENAREIFEKIKKLKTFCDEDFDEKFISNYFNIYGYEVFIAAEFTDYRKQEGDNITRPIGYLISALKKKSYINISEKRQLKVQAEKETQIKILKPKDTGEITFTPEVIKRLTDEIMEEVTGGKGG
ncbi:MAG: helix-turn-helix domain-containing protein [bacterium]